MDGSIDLARTQHLGHTTVVGFLVALAILFVLLFIVGIGAVLSALAAADPAVLLFIGALVMIWIVAWSGSLLVTGRFMGANLSLIEAILLYTHLMFLDNVVPFSSVSADPFAALTVSRVTDTDYETSLATVITVDFLNFLPAPAIGLAGLVHLFASNDLDESVWRLALSLSALLVGLSIVGYLAWRFRRPLGRSLSDVAAAVLRVIDRLFPGVSEADQHNVNRKMQRLIGQLEELIEHRGAILLISTFAVVGWVLLATTLWLSMYAVGDTIPFSLSLFLVSLVTVGELVPLPGGVGTSESLFVALLVSVGGIAPAVATAGILVHRGATYWLPVILGGGVIPLLLDLDD